MDIVERYGIHSLSPVVSALGPGRRARHSHLRGSAGRRRDAVARLPPDQEREKAARRAQIIVIPATGVALALAGILVYPPFASLTGGGLSGIP